MKKELELGNGLSKLFTEAEKIKMRKDLLKVDYALWSKEFNDDGSVKC